MYDQFIVKQSHNLEYRVAFLTRNKAISKFFTSMAINTVRTWRWHSAQPMSRL
jgi:hypothetical protein